MVANQPAGAMLKAMDTSQAPVVDAGLMRQAVELAQLAGTFTLEHFRNPSLHVDTKGDGTPVTVADRGAEKLLREKINELFESDGIFGEEQAEQPGTSGRRWIIDPIDGTKAFTHGVPLYTNLLALQDEFGIAVGVINIPALDETIYAARGCGAWSNGERIHVNDTGQFDGAWVMTSGFAAWKGDIVNTCNEQGIHLRTWGDAYGYAMVASGRAEAMVDAVAELYDLAPVPVIMHEAGGRFSDLGGSNDPGNGSGIASNGALHEPLRALFATQRIVDDPAV